MIELVIVVVIIGIIAAIAVPRMDGITERAKKRRVIADLHTLQKSGEHYTVEHAGKNVGIRPNGSAVLEAVLVARMVGTSDEAGVPDGSGSFGPYIRGIPENAMNQLGTIRIDGAAAGANTHGWRFDTATGQFASDVSFTVTLPDGSKVDHTGKVTAIGVDLGGMDLGGMDLGG